jgi:hypothetical protein
MNRKTIFAIILITGTLLLIPLIAMQFTSEIVWTPMDFVVAGVLLLCAGFALVYLWKKLAQSNYRLYIIVGLILLFLLLWTELAVGIFGSPLAGS